MAGDLVTLETRGHVAVLTLNRPDKRNALNDAMGLRMHELLDDIEAQFPALRAVVLTGSGTAFSAGGDSGQIAERTGAGAAPAAAVGREIVDLAPHLRRISQPVIAAINGIAVGAGLALACASDIRFAAASAKFTCPFVRFCLTADTGLSQSLQRIIGPGLAAEMILTGATYDADWAQRVGLVNAVLPDDAMLEHAIAVATKIAEHAPIAVRGNKKALDVFGPDLTRAIVLEREFNRQSAGSEDREEAARAFMEKRPPVFKGR